MPAIKRCVVSYTVAADETDEERHLICETLDSGRYVCSDPNAAITVTFDGEVFDIELQAFRDIRITACSVDASHRFLKTERVLLNGYQSWTDTVESDINAFRHGLRGLPRNLIDHFLLDTAGDYRFTEYGFTPGLMHGWTYASMRRGGSCCLIASLNEDNGFTLIRFNMHGHLIRLEKEVPQRVVAAGEKLHLCTMALIFRSAAEFQPGDKNVIGVPAAEEDAFDRWFELMGIKRLPAKPMVGYSSWYRHFDSVDEGKVRADLDAAATVMADMDTRGFQRVFQIDDGYAKVGDWLETYHEKFPNGLKPLVGQIKAAGFKPGLWMAPFACEMDSCTYLNHPDWLLRDKHGAPVRTGTHWNGGFALDTLNPEAREFLTRILQTVTQDWGFELLKVDFLYAACMVPHGGMNRGQLMADGMQLIRDAVGADVQLLGCGVPLASAFGRVEYCRIGCDVGLDWNNRFYYSILSRERISTKRSLANTVGRAPLNGRAFLNDPDVFFLRDDIAMEFEQKDLLLKGDACFGGSLLTSDNMLSWRPEDKAKFQEAIYLMRTALGRFDDGPRKDETRNNGPQDAGDAQ